MMQCMLTGPYWHTISRIAAVVSDIWIFMGNPVDSIKLATSTVSLGQKLQWQDKTYDVSSHYEEYRYYSSNNFPPSQIKTTCNSKLITVRGAVSAEKNHKSVSTCMALRGRKE